MHDLRFSEEDLASWGTVLDLGSGRFQMFAREVRDAGFTTSVISVDPKLAYLDSGSPMNKHNLDAVPGVLAALAQELPFRDNTFDAVLALFSVPLYCEDTNCVRRSLLEIIRVLKHGASAYIAPAPSFSEESTSTASVHARFFYDTLATLKGEGYISFEIAPPPSAMEFVRRRVIITKLDDIAQEEGGTTEEVGTTRWD